MVFFDFDGTLTSKDSFLLFARHAVGLRRLLTGLVKSFVPLVKWKLRKISGSEAKEILFGKLYKGMARHEFESRCKSFASIIDRHLRSEVYEAFKLHLDQGSRVVIVSASIEDWIKPWAEKEGEVKVIATEVETDREGRLTGRFKTPNCKGMEKIRRIREEVPDLDQYEIWAYGDSDADKPMLSMAAKAVKV